MSEQQINRVPRPDHPLRIAVIADTHDIFPHFLGATIAGADEIWHLGDVCSADTLDCIRRLGPPLIVVRGNNDMEPSWPLEISLERNGISFRLIHIPPLLSALGKSAILLHGHTHVPRDEVIQGIRILNPGTIGKPNKGVPPSYAWLEISTQGTISWKVIPL